MKSTEAAHDAIERADEETMRLVLMGAVVNRVEIPRTDEERIEWLKRDATAEETRRAYERGRREK